MVTSLSFSWFRLCVVGLLAVGCGGSTVAEENPSIDPATPSPSHPNPTATGSAYDGKGFVVHEWGTNTVVSGSDGSLLPGLHHEEEGLPGFVYDRLRAAERIGPDAVLKLDCTGKLETPVTYFYSESPRTVRVSVDFPTGVYTQWYPGVRAFFPLVVEPCSAPGTIGDPVLDPSFPFMLEECRTKYSAIGGGLLDWGQVEVLARDATVEAALPEAPLHEFTWSHARAVAANPIRVGSEAERFLFYRGLGNHALPVTVRATGQGRVEVSNTDLAHAMGPVFVLNVGSERADFRLHERGLEPGASLAETAPELATAPLLGEYEAKLGESMADALESSGLYRDEALAMVDTWKRQWFRTPGIRVLYLLPQALTEAMIPLHVTPAPDVMVRTVVMRVELIPPELEAQDVAALGGVQAETYFRGLGRFAEPRLRRAVAIAGSSPTSEQLLGVIAGAQTVHALGE